jgi:glutamate-1-semialdehyde 2,1-aminomutase
MIFDNSNNAFAKAQQVIPGGVNSPVRAFKSVGRKPVFIKKGYGPFMEDIDGNKYIDYVLSWGPLILGHSDPDIVKSLYSSIDSGTSFGAPTEVETEIAQLIVDAFPGMDMVRMVNSGTEATMSALRLARAYTKRDKILKFEGCYHGHSDSLLIKAGSGALTLGVPSSPGVPSDIASGTITGRYNDLENLKEIFHNYQGQIAGVIIEPVAGNMGVVPGNIQFLKELRKLCTEQGTVLIFDEVMSGFRVAWGGAQVIFDIEPDLTTLGKIIGGGLPVGAYGGKREIMELVAPLGPMYQAGTLSGNPLAMNAGLTALKKLRDTDAYDFLEKQSEKLENGLKLLTDKYSVNASFNRVGSMVGMFFNDEQVNNFDIAVKSDVQKFSKFFNGLLELGVYIAPSQFESWFLSTKHDDSIINETLEKSETVLKNL